MQQQIFSLATWGPGEGPKDQISFNVNYEVNFKDFYTKCVFSQIKYKKQLFQNFHYMFLVMPQMWDLGVTVVKKKFWAFFKGALLIACSGF